ncbi:hypothetical protein B0T10DRAFT_467011 [Thelonectria olida]|uniref:LysM domain-containing protein n=1 Tax=Thelonectria olida TaxID=1576542 RepID=A0A9P8VQU4_9HYPO|nr:hypothetical protein B0T10DRAFT_467011 [Thelonectria olida]
MNLVIFFLQISLASSTCTKTYGLWVPEKGQTFFMAVDAIDQVGDTEIQSLNPGINIEDIEVRKTYTLPHKSAISPADWSNDCPPYLLLNAQTTSEAGTLATATESGGSTNTTLYTSLVNRDKPTTETVASTASSNDETPTSHNTENSERGASTNPVTATTTIRTDATKTTSRESTTSTSSITCWDGGNVFSWGKSLRDDNSIRFCGTQKEHVIGEDGWWREYYYLDGTSESQQFEVRWIPGCQGDPEAVTGNEKCNSSLRGIGEKCKRPQILSRMLN